MNELKVDSDGEGLRIAIVQSRFNESIGEAQREACLKELLALGVDLNDIVAITVPGALEIPLALSQLGAVIRGETYHFEIVSNESAAGIGRVAMEFHIPIANGVLTTDTDEQAAVRATDKGRDCARVAVEMANLLFAIDDQLSSDDE